MNSIVGVYIRISFWLWQLISGMASRVQKKTTKWKEVVNMHIHTIKIFIYFSGIPCDSGTSSFSSET